MSTVDQMWLTNYLPIRNIDNKVPDARFRTKKLLKQHRFIHAAWQKAKMSNNQISKKHAKTLKQFIDKDSALKYFTPTSEVLLKIEQNPILPFPEQNKNFPTEFSYAFPQTINFNKYNLRDRNEIIGELFGSINNNPHINPNAIQPYDFNQPLDAQIKNNIQSGPPAAGAYIDGKLNMFEMQFFNLCLNSCDTIAELADLLEFFSDIDDSYKISNYDLITTPFYIGLIDKRSTPPQDDKQADPNSYGGWVTAQEYTTEIDPLLIHEDLLIIFFSVIHFKDSSTESELIKTAFPQFTPSDMQKIKARYIKLTDAPKPVLKTLSFLAMKAITTNVLKLKLNNNYENIHLNQKMLGSINKIFKYYASAGLGVMNQISPSNTFHSVATLKHQSTLVLKGATASNGDLTKVMELESIYVKLRKNLALIVTLQEIVIPWIICMGDNLPEVPIGPPESSKPEFYKNDSMWFDEIKKIYNKIRTIYPNLKDQCTGLIETYQRNTNAGTEDLGGNFKENLVSIFGLYQDGTTYVDYLRNQRNDAEADMFSTKFTQFMNMGQDASNLAQQLLQIFLDALKQLPDINEYAFISAFDEKTSSGEILEFVKPILRALRMFKGEAPFHSEMLHSHVQLGFNNICGYMDALARSEGVKKEDYCNLINPLCEIKQYKSGGRERKSCTVPKGNSSMHSKAVLGYLKMINLMMSLDVNNNTIDGQYKNNEGDTFTLFNTYEKLVEGYVNIIINVDNNDYSHYYTAMYGKKQENMKIKLESLAKKGNTYKNKIIQAFTNPSDYVARAKDGYRIKEKLTTKTNKITKSQFEELLLKSREELKAEMEIEEEAPPSPSQQLPQQLPQQPPPQPPAQPPAQQQLPPQLPPQLPQQPPLPPSQQQLPPPPLQPPPPPPAQQQPPPAQQQPLPPSSGASALTDAELQSFQVVSRKKKGKVQAGAPTGGIKKPQRSLASVSASSLASGSASSSNQFAELMDLEEQVVQPQDVSSF